MMRRARYLTALPILLLAGSHARADERVNYESYGRVPAVHDAMAAAAAKQTRGYIAGVDEQRGTPTFFWAERGVPLPASVATASKEAIARYHLKRNAALYGLTPAAIATAKVALVHDTGRGGIIVIFRQSIDGVEVMHSDMKVLTNRKGELVAIGGSLHPAAVAGAEKKMPKSKLGQADAIRRPLA